MINPLKSLESIEKKLTQVDSHIEMTERAIVRNTKDVFMQHERLVEPLVVSLTKDLVDISNRLGHLFELMGYMQTEIKALRAEMGRDRTTARPGRKRTPEERARMATTMKENWRKRRERSSTQIAQQESA